MDERCTVLVSSCDAYSDVWKPFFTLLTKNWQMEYPVRLLTETKDFSYPLKDFRVIKAAEGAAASTWSARLIYALEQIKTPYVLLLLEDFFLTAPVDEEGLEKCIGWLKEDNDAVCFSFYPTTGNEKARYEGFDRRPQTGLYRFNAQAGLWRTKELESFLDPKEDAWQWENEGNKRSFDIKRDFYSISPDAKPIFAYDYMKHGLIGGKWFKDTEELFRQNRIECDFSKRGFFDEKYKALLPSVASSFVMDDVLYFDRGGGFCESDTLRSGKNLRSGEFCFEYRINGDSAKLRWDPSSKTSFAVLGLNIRIDYENGFVQTLPLWKLKTNGKRYKNGFVFLKYDPYICFLAEKRGIISVTVTGQAVCPLEKSAIDKTFGKRTGSLGYSINKLFHLRRS